MLLFLLVPAAVLAQWTQPADVFHRDINKDGFEDVRIETHAFVQPASSKQPQRITTVHLFYGHADGIGTVPDSTYVITSMEKKNEHTRLADVNRDGISDSVVVKDSIVWVYPGTIHGISPQQMLTFSFALPVKKERTWFLYDYNGDAVADLLLSTYHVLGNLSTVTKTEIRWQVVPGELYGVNANPIDLPELKDKDVSVLQDFDFNHDGREDLVLTYTNAALQRCNDLWLGRYKSVPDKKPWKRWKISIAGNNDYRLYPAGDMNGDGYSDLLVAQRLSQKEARKQQSSVIQLMLYAGSQQGLNDTPVCVLPLQEPSPFYYYSLTVLSKVDVDGDGFEDCIVSGNGSSGMAIWGGAQTPVATSYPFSALTKEPGTEAPRYQAAGDLNGDGKDDLILTYQKRFWVVYGNSNRLLNARELNGIRK